MYFKTFLRNGGILIAACVLTFTACNKKSTTTAAPALTNSDDNGGYATDAARLETTSNDVISISDAAAGSGATNLQRTTVTYPTVTFTVSGSDTIMTINFGPTDHLCLDGNNRKGEIIVTYSGKYKDSGSVHTITYSGYYLNDNQVAGLKTVTNEGTNISGQVWYNVTVNDSITLAGTDSVISWTGSRTRTWLEGYSTPTRTDDVYSIGGTTVLTRANGHVFTFDITSPLTVALSCPWIEAGTVDISSTSFTGGDRILDYGSGGCDDEATVTIGSHTYDITLRR